MVGMSERLPVRNRALSAELKRLREKAGLTTRKAASLYGMSPAGLNRSETGKRMATPEEVSGLLAIYGVKGEERRRLMDLARPEESSGWWETSRQARHLSALIDFEAAATSIIQYATLLVPGLLQTPAYARDIIGRGGYTPDEVDRLVAVRMKRQRILFRLLPPNYLVLLDEAVLRRPFGGGPTMAAQVRWLIDMAKRQRVSIHVVPFKHGGYDAAGCFSIYDFAKGSRVVYLENRGASAFLDHPEDTAPFPPDVAAMLDVALNSSDSVEFMAWMVADHERS